MLRYQHYGRGPSNVVHHSSARGHNSDFDNDVLAHARDVAARPRSRPARSPRAPTSRRCASKRVGNASIQGMCAQPATAASQAHDGIGGVVADYMEIMDILRCPMCGRQVGFPSTRTEELWCLNEYCTRREPFPILHGCPVFLANDRSLVAEGELLRTGGTSQVRRVSARAKARSLARRAILGSRSAGGAIAEEFIAQLPPASGEPGRVLVIGGATRGEGVDRLEAAGLRTVSLDVYYSTDVTLLADGHDLPFADASFCGIWIQSVLEHVLDPTRVVSEATRVLRTGGVVFAESSFQEPVHEGAFDFFRFTLSGHRWLFRAFEEIDAGAAAGLATHVGLALEYFCRALFRSRRAGKAVRFLVAPLRLLEPLLDSRAVLDASPLVYFLGRKSVSALPLNAMPAYYRGRDGAW